MAQSKLIYIGVKGAVLALNAATGQQVWSTNLKGTDFVNVVLDGENLYATTRGEIFCLDPATGDGRWHNALKGYGWGLVSVAGTGISSAGGGNVLAAEKRRRDEAAANSAAGSNSPAP